MRMTIRVRFVTCALGVTAVLLSPGWPVGRGSLAAQTAGAPAQKNGVTCRTEQVKMRDGTLLATDVYLPSGPGPHPVILQRTPYGLRLGHGCFVGTSGNMAFWAEHGYAAVNQDVRGTFRSQGMFDPMFQEQADGYDAVEWAAAQPWSNGKVAMTGASYFGVTQWQAAVTNPPHLVAISPSITASDYHDHWTYQNGVFDLWMGQSWVMNYFASDEYRRRLLAKGASEQDALETSDAWLAEAKEKLYPSWARVLPLTGFDEFRTFAPYYYTWLQHPYYDEYWAKVDLEKQWDRIKVPALIHGTWRDLFAIGSVRSFLGMQASGGSAGARNGSMLVMHASGGHGGTGLLNYPSATEVNLEALRLRFYDRYLKGIDNGIDQEPRVQVFVQVQPDSGRDGSSYLVTADAFPPSGTQKVRYNLRSDGRANTRRGDGVLDANRPSEGPGDTFTYDPNDPLPPLGGGLCCASMHERVAGPDSGMVSGAQNQALLELRDDVLVYTSAPLERSVTVIGPVTVRFWAQTSARDTDFAVKLVDVLPDGTAYNMMDRILRASLRNGSKSAPSPIEPGKPYEFTLDLGYTASVFKAGHRIRLDITSSRFPHLARNLNTGKHPASDAQIEVATQTILHDSSHPSYLELSVVPEARGASASN